MCISAHLHICTTDVFFNETCFLFDVLKPYSKYSTLLNLIHEEKRGKM